MEQDLESFRSSVEDIVYHHPVVMDNTYTKWFAKGEASRGEVRHLAVQFSVFSHQFVEASLRKVINAADLQTYRAGKEILMNELGVVYRPPGGRREVADAEDPELVGTEGSVDASTFRFSAAHFEWLLNFGAPLGLSFEDMGKRRHATPGTRFFCDELLRIYGAEDASIAEGASFAVEHWAAAGFWKELIAGLKAFKDRECPGLPLGFWIWHDKIEDQHAAHTSDELGQAFAMPGFDQEKFIEGAREMLDGVRAFWDGLWGDHVVGRAA
ncbi:MAG: hypothetical protein QOD62_2810 [Actinomycetota bacterium]|nr:hypothetical protein [Actinomycetota bacterium]